MLTTASVDFSEDRKSNCMLHLTVFVVFNGEVINEQGKNDWPVKKRYGFQTMVYMFNDCEIQASGCMCFS